MLSVFVESRALAFSTVLMDSWYATKSVMLHIESLGKVYYCPLKSNRRVDDSNATRPYQRMDALEWMPSELESGKRIKIRGFPKNHKVKVFRVASTSRRTDYVVTNDLSQSDTSVAQTVCAWRWKIEQFHRETKQLTGLEVVNVVWRVLFAITLLAPFSFGFDSCVKHMKPLKPFIKSNMVCSLNISENNSNRLR